MKHEFHQIPFLGHVCSRCGEIKSPATKPQCIPVFPEPNVEAMKLAWEMRRAQANG